jgi:hypothetical protein
LHERILTNWSWRVCQIVWRVKSKGMSSFESRIALRRVHEHWIRSVYFVQCLFLSRWDSCCFTMSTSRGQNCFGSIVLLKNQKQRQHNEIYWIKTLECQKCLHPNRTYWNRQLCVFDHQNQYRPDSPEYQLQRNICIKVWLVKHNDMVLFTNRFQNSVPKFSLQSTLAYSLKCFGWLPSIDCAITLAPIWRVVPLFHAPENITKT